MVTFLLFFIPKLKFQMIIISTRNHVPLSHLTEKFFFILWYYKVPGGRALIINNELFDDPDYDRSGSTVDVKNLKALKGEMDFQVI